MAWQSHWKPSLQVNTQHINPNIISRVIWETTMKLFGTKMVELCSACIKMALTRKEFQGWDKQLQCKTKRRTLDTGNWTSSNLDEDSPYKYKKFNQVWTQNSLKILSYSGIKTKQTKNPDCLLIHIIKAILFIWMQ